LSKFEHNQRLTFLICALLSVLTLVVYWSVTRNGFIIYDDRQYVLENSHVITGLTWANVAWAFTSFYAGNWHPLTWLSHMLDVQLFGARSFGPHLVNLLLHTANTVLLFLALRRISGATWRCALVAALFALHPLHVESVAWVAERKDVLSALFFLLALLSYGEYAKRRPAVLTPAPADTSTLERSHAPRFYFLTLLAFALGLLSKPMLVTTPFVLLLLDYWPLRRFEFEFGKPLPRKILPLVLEKIPFLVLAAASSVVTCLSQNAGGAMASFERLPIEARLDNAFVAYGAYLQHMFWPGRLELLYLPPAEWPFGQVVLTVLALAAVTALILMAARSHPYLLTGWFWFIGMLVPVIGLVQVGNQFMADRYSYLPLIGCFIIFCWGGAELIQKWPLVKPLAFCATALVLVALGIVAERQIRFWKNSETILTRSIEVNPNNFIAHNMLAAALDDEGRFDDAKVHFHEALHVKPGDADTLHNFGVALAKHGEFDEADGYLEQAVRLNPKLVTVYGKLGLILDSQGNVQKAIAYYRQALLANPDEPRICNNLAWLLATTWRADLRDGKEAVRLAEHACGLAGNKNPFLIGTLAAAYAEAGRFPEAVTAAQNAIALATTTGETQLATRNRQLLELYQAGKAFHELAPP
jgi:Flp pilus assembly protein TadD